ncbi:MAG: AraC family transcriptional regulator [Eubacteriales bacterium]|nr:AraC family transcriptional regulator [Eubacteriales bacterium]
MYQSQRSARSASAAAALLYGKLPACERRSLCSREIDNAVEYLCSNFTQRAVKLSDLAERSNFSVGYFSLLFRKNTGLSFTDYLTILRMEKARELLETTGLSVRQVSDSCGFTAVSYFTRYFSQKAHCSPKEWRKHHCAE